MNVGEIITDAIEYPLHNIKSFVIYLILGIVAAIIGGTTIITAITVFRTNGIATTTFTGLGIVQMIIFIILLFLIGGYGLDIVKYGIERRTDGPGIDFGRQVLNAAKLIVVDIIYYVVPSIIILVLGLFLRSWIMTIIALILFIVFALANFMAKCRLAKTDDLGYALAIGEAIGDISRVGLGKIIVIAILVFLIAFIIILIVGLIGALNDLIGDILFGLALVYIIFFYNRAIGLLYSDV